MLQLGHTTVKCAGRRQTLTQTDTLQHTATHCNTLQWAHDGQVRRQHGGAFKDLVTHQWAASQVCAPRPDGVCTATHTATHFNIHKCVHRAPMVMVLVLFPMVTVKKGCHVCALTLGGQVSRTPS